MTKYALALVAGLIATPAMSADISPAPYKAPATFITPVSEWTGFYAGLNAGYASGDVTVRDNLNPADGVAPGPFKYSPTGFIGGGHAGYNWQNGAFLFGIEGDLGYIGTTGKGRIGSSVAAAHQDLTLDGGFYGDITGRLGIVSGNWVLYGKGGYAYFDGKSSQTTTNAGFVTNPATGFSGWTAGAGVEWLFAKNVSLKVEYQHFDFGSKIGDQTSITDVPVGHVYTNKTDLTFDTVKAGLSYYWN